MAENSFIPVFPPTGLQASPGGRNTTAGRGGAQHANRSNNTNAAQNGRGRGQQSQRSGGNAGRGGGRGGGNNSRRRYKPGGGSSGYSDLANAMKDEAARIRGDFDALREQVKLTNEKLEEKDNSERRKKAYLKHKLLSGLSKINVEFKSATAPYGKSRVQRVFEVLIFLFLFFFTVIKQYFDLVNVLCLLFIVQLIMFMLAELSLELVRMDALLREWWYIALCVVSTLICWSMILLDRHYMDWLMIYYLAICPIYFILYSFIFSMLCRFGYLNIRIIRDSFFGWFIGCVCVSVTKWDNPKPMFYSLDPGVDLRPQSQRHIKLTDAEMKFSLNYRKVDRVEMTLLVRISSLFNDYTQHTLEPLPDIVYELSKTNKTKTLEASYGLLCELSDYDVCGLETDPVIAKERIKNRLRTIRSVNVDKYLAQSNNIYAHTTLVALALWLQRKQDLKGLPDFD